MHSMAKCGQLAVSSGGLSHVKLLEWALQVSNGFREF